MNGETSLRPPKFDELCDKLAEKYGENPESVWREAVGDEVADDAGDVDWYESNYQLSLLCTVVLILAFAGMHCSKRRIRRLLETRSCDSVSKHRQCMRIIHRCLLIRAHRQ